MSIDKIKKIKEYVKREYYLLPWCLFIFDGLLVVGAHVESTLVRSMSLLLTNSRPYNMYKNSMLVISIIILGLCITISLAVWRRFIHKAVGRWIDRSLLYLIWAMLSIFFCIPLSMGLLCNWSFQAVWFSIGKIVTVALIITALCEGCILIFCKEF